MLTYGVEGALLRPLKRAVEIYVKPRSRFSAVLNRRTSVMRAQQLNNLFEASTWKDDVTRLKLGT